MDWDDLTQAKVGLVRNGRWLRHLGSCGNLFEPAGKENLGVLPSHAVEFDELAAADLIVDRIYKGGSAGNAGDDPLSRLLPGVGNQGGFRMYGRPVRGTVKLVVLYTSGAEPD